MTSPADAGSRIVVGYDGSEAAMRAVRWAADEARLRGCPLELVLAYDDSVPAMSFGLSTVDSTPSQRHLARRARAAVQSVVQRIGGAGLIVTATVVPGRPGPALVAAADGAQLLVLGPSQHSALNRVVAGSTVTHCRRHASCPVVVVRSAALPAAEEPEQVAASG